MNWLRFTVLPFLFLCVAIAAQEVTAQEPSSSSNAIKEINAVAASLDNIMLHLDAIIEQAQQHKIAVKKVQALLKELLANPERLQKYKIQRTKGELGLKSLMLEEAITSIDLTLAKSNPFCLFVIKVLVPRRCREWLSDGKCKLWEPEHYEWVCAEDVKWVKVWVERRCTEWLPDGKCKLWEPGHYEEHAE